MESLDTQRIIRALRDDWGELITRYQQLTPEQQEHYLSTQGYQRIPDLLAHVTAWWERGMRLIERYQVEPGFVAPEVAVDDFNAAAVASIQQQGEQVVISLFHASLQRFMNVVEQLDDEARHDQRIIRQIEMEVIGHFREHQIK